tara:strand:+ start:1646 stop:2356 length:711 start_codon:yes stop_codon:yes gene_type:complete
MKIIPAIDLINGLAVRLTKGDFDQKRVYKNDPVLLAEEFDEVGLKYLHVVDLDAAKGVSDNLNVIEKIASIPNIQVDAGGGIKTVDQVSKLVDVGVNQVTVGSVSVKQPEVFSEMVKRYPKQVILAADFHDNFVAVHGWQERSKLTVNQLIDQYLDDGLQYVMCTDISKDGTLSGVNVDWYVEKQNQYPQLEIIASGGVKDISDLQVLQQAGIKATIVGKAYYEGNITLKQLTELC